MTSGKEPRVAPIFKQQVPPAPHMTSRGACSDCQIPAIIAGDGDMKICPRCYALLWRRDYSAEERLKRQEATRIAAAAAAVRRAEKEAQRQLDREIEIKK